MRRSFYRQDAVTLAPKLLGCLLLHRTPQGVAGGMIVETEAYVGAIDKACHAHKGRTPRTEIMFHAGGHAYVYLIYGMYHCFNVVTGPEGEGNAVLIRALEPVLGLDLMRQRRGTERIRDLCRGPGRLCQALDIGKEQYGADLCRKGSSLYLADFRHFPAGQIGTSPRINVDYAEEAAVWPWRFYLKNNIYVSG